MKKLASISTFFLFLFIFLMIVGILSENAKTTNVAQIDRVNLPLNKLTTALAFYGEVSLIDSTNYIVIFDDSGSMSGSKMSEAKNALRFFLQNLKSNDTIAMISLNSGIFKGKNDIFQNFKSIKADGGTPLGKALKKAKNYIESLIKNNSGYGKYVIVSISDGFATDVSDNELEELLKSIFEIKEADVALKTIGFYMDSYGNMLNSKYTEYISANSMQELQNAFSQILAEEDDFLSDTNTTF